MSHEPLSNIGLVCDKHAPKPDPRFLKIPLEKYVGKYVKCRFVVPNPPDRKGKKRAVEFMWVKVLGVKVYRRRRQLHGELNNDPVIYPAKCGDQFLFNRDEIVAIDPTSE